MAAAREGAEVAIGYLNEDDDAAEASRLVGEHQRRCLTLRGDIGDEEFCKSAIEQTHSTFGRLDVVVNDAGEQHAADKPEEISAVSA